MAETKPIKEEKEVVSKISGFIIKALPRKDRNKKGKNIFGNFSFKKILAKKTTKIGEVCIKILALPSFIVDIV